jgi:hypothetical protein
MSYSLKPYVNFNLDESIVAQELSKNYPEGNVFLTTKDIGIDLLLLPNVSENKAIRIQVKGSKLHYNPKKGLTDDSAGGWISISKQKLETYVKVTDYIIFIIHNIVPDKKNKFKFEPFFINIKSTELLLLAKKHKKLSKNNYNFYFTKKGSDIVDNRDEEYSFGEYINNWNLK